MSIRSISIVALLVFASNAAADDPLPSWNDGPSKQAIIDFVAQVSEKGSSAFVPPAERIAVFDKDGKPVAINHHIGRRPIAAFGNSDGDLQMLQWTCAGDGARLCVYVHHTDAEREWAYDRESHIGKLDEGLDQAHEDGWTVINMKNDWKAIFPDSPRQ